LRCQQRIRVSILLSAFDDGWQGGARSLREFLERRPLVRAVVRREAHREGTVEWTARLPAHACSPLFAPCSPLFDPCSPLFAPCSPLFAPCSPLFAPSYPRICPPARAQLTDRAARELGGALAYDRRLILLSLRANRLTAETEEEVGLRGARAVPCGMGLWARVKCLGVSNKECAKSVGHRIRGALRRRCARRARASSRGGCVCMCASACACQHVCMCVCVCDRWWLL
jgi:hypothetical protein